MSNILNLPADGFAEKIIETIKNNPVTILMAEPGAGLSTHVPFAVMAGIGGHVIVTEPSKLAVESLAMRVAQERELTLGGLVGYQTATEKVNRKGTYLLYCTEGLNLVRGLVDSKKDHKNGLVLIIDNVHEFNEYIEILMAWSRELIKSGTNIKFVLMSAPLEDDSLSTYFNGAPIIRIPGKACHVSGAPCKNLSPYQIKREEMIREIEFRVTRHKSTLVLLSGRSEIKRVAEEIQTLDLDAKILEIHNDLSRDEQVKIFQTYGKPVLILATDIAQSLVIPNVDCIIDSGLQTKLELVNAVERLVKKHLPKTAIQRRSSKAGRTKEGAYVLCSDVPYEELPDYGEPEIYEKCIDKLTLAIATSGLESLNLHFFHPLDPVLLQESKKMLVTIGALDSEGAITELGRQLRLFPTSVMLGRMILEGVKRKCLTRVLTFAAILSTVKRSIKLTRSKNRDYPEFVKEWSEAVPSDKQYDSDLLAEYDLWEFGYQDITTLQHHGIERKSYLEAVDIRQKLVFLLHKMGYHTGPEYNEYANDDSEVLKCIAAGMIYHVYRYGGQKNKYVGRDVRFLSKESLINRGDYPQLIVGIPYDIPVPKKSEEGTAIIPILTHCTAIDPAWLSELAPELMQTVEYPAGWNYEKLMLTQETVTYFNEVEIMRVSTPVKYSEQNLVILANYMSRAFLPGDDLRTSWIEKLRQEFFDKKLGDTFAFAKEFIRHTEDYQTVVLSELSRHKGSIRGLILGLLERGVRKFDDLPAVENDNYISVINDFVIKKRGTMRFDFQEKPIGKQIMRFATCYVSLNGTEYALEGEFASTHKIAKRNAAKVMYQKLAEMKDEILLPAGSIKPKPLQVVSKNVWELPEVKNDDYTLAIRFFADKYTAVVSYRLIGGYSKGYKATSVCRLAFKGMAYEEKGNTAPNNFSAKQSAAKKMYEKLSGIIVESLSLVS